MVEYRIMPNDMAVLGVPRRCSPNIPNDLGFADWNKTEPEWIEITCHPGGLINV